MDFQAPSHILLAHEKRSWHDIVTARGYGWLLEKERVASSVTRFQPHQLILTAIWSVSMFRVVRPLPIPSPCVRSYQTSEILDEIALECEEYRGQMNHPFWQRTSSRSQIDIGIDWTSGSSQTIPSPIVTRFDTIRLPRIR
jgi:hypothetical protein